MSTSSTTFARALVLVFALGLAGCGEEGPAEDPVVPTTPPEASSSESPSRSLSLDELVIADPDRPHESVEFVETESEAVADRLLSFSDLLRKREFGSLGDFFSRDFVGMRLEGWPARTETSGEGPLGITHTEFALVAGSVELAARSPVDREGFLASIEALVGPWSRVESVLWKVKGAEFQKGLRSWGKVRLKLHILGQEPGGSMVAVHGWADARVTNRNGKYRIDRLRLTELGQETRSGPMFAEVAAATGLAHTWARFGTDGNQSFHWNGAAAGDVDGDGDWDLFVPSDGKNFLYLAQPDGTWIDVAEEHGVAGPAEGTGAIFFDCDRDGDQDLMVGHVGWKEPDGSAAGQRIRLYLNDGKGKYTEFQGGGFGPEGFGKPFVAYTLTAFDYDGDGWLDVHVCSYGRLESEHNDSWIEATNGSPNALLRCLGKSEAGAFLGFEDAAKSAGIVDGRWSYAAAASDVDLDGDIDLFVANDYGSNRMWVNQGDGTFKDEADALGVSDRGNGMGAAFGDLTSDGRLDLYVANMSSTAGNRILGRLSEDLDAETHAMLKKLAAGNSIFAASKDGAGFERLPRENGGIGANWAWSSALTDLDLDGDLDVFCANGFVTGKLPFDT